MSRPPSHADASEPFLAIAIGGSENRPSVRGRKSTKVAPGRKPELETPQVSMLSSSEGTPNGRQSAAAAPTRTPTMVNRPRIAISRRLVKRIALSTPRCLGSFRYPTPNTGYRRRSSHNPSCTSYSHHLTSIRKRCCQHRCQAKSSMDRELELTRFGGHPDTWDRESRKEVRHAPQVHPRVPAGVPG